jgi:hypothetical protein
MARLLDYTIDGGAEFFHLDDAEDKVIIRRIVDVEPRIEANKKLQNATDGYTPSRDLRRIASIPPSIVHKWMVEDGINIYDRNHWPAVMRKLRDPDWRWLKTVSGPI